MTARGLHQTEARLEVPRASWVEVLPGDRVRDIAEGLPEQYGLRALDSFQLAAAKLAAKERTREIARQFADYCRKLDGAFETVSIPFEKKREMPTVLRVTVLAHSNGALKLQTNLGAILAICPEIKSLVSSQIGIGAGRRRRSGGCGSGRCRRAG